MKFVVADRLMHGSSRDAGRNCLELRKSTKIFGPIHHHFDLHVRVISLFGLVFRWAKSLSTLTGSRGKFIITGIYMSSNIIIILKQKSVIQTNRQKNITGLQTSKYDIFAKLSQLDICKPTRLPPYCWLIMSLQETGGKTASTAAVRSGTLTSSWQYLKYVAAVKYSFAQAGNISPTL